MNLSPRKLLSQKYLRKYYDVIFYEIRTDGFFSKALEDTVCEYKKLFPRGVFSENKKHPIYVSYDEFVTIKDLLYQLDDVIYFFHQFSRRAKANGSLWIGNLTSLEKLYYLEDRIQTMIYRLSHLTDDIYSIGDGYYSDSDSVNSIIKDINIMNKHLKELMNDIKKHYKHIEYEDKQHTQELKKKNSLKQEKLNIAQQEADNETKRLNTISEQALEEQKKCRQLKEKQEEIKSLEANNAVKNLEIQAQESDNEKNRLNMQEKENQTREQEAKNKQEALRIQEEKDKQQFALEKEKAETDTAALNNFSKVEEIPVRYFFEYFREKFAHLTKDNLSGDDQNTLLEIHGWFKDVYTRNHMIDPDRLEAVAPDVKRINQIETMMDLYGEKIRKVKHDDTLDDEERQMKVEYWMRLRDRDINELEK